MSAHTYLQKHLHMSIANFSGDSFAQLLMKRLSLMDTEITVLPLRQR